MSKLLGVVEGYEDDLFLKVKVRRLAELHNKENALKELTAAIDSQWKKTTPPKKLIEPLRKAKELLGE